ncbi:hypothetical protein H4R22_002076 [Coemansia sp. RSA 1290]|nr:hypothetical protein H4R22_002076 [Coemansia sp. RSA 1290]
MLDNLVPRYPYMVIEKDFHMPRLGDNLEKCGTLDPRRGSDSESKIATGLETMSTRSYDILRHLMLDRDIKSAYFFTDILRLSLQILPSLESRGLDSDCIDKNELARVSYDICLGAMTVIRLWLTSKKEYRPVHLLPDEENEEILAGVISDYMGYIYRLLLWMVDKGDWNKRTLVLLYNGLQIHRAVMRLYRHHLPQDVKRGFMNSLQRIAVLFLKKPAKERRDEITMESFPNRALSIIVECLISGWMVLGDPVSSIALRFKELYMVPTVWTSHLNTWCNVLRALTIARGRHILKVEERTLIQESMFAGQRQRRGLNKVDEYLLNLKNPMYYLNDTTLRDGYETSTPFSITSNMTWDTMRLVFATTKVAANEEVAFAQACMQQCQSTETKLADPSSDYQSKALLKVTQSVYARIFLSGARNLTLLTGDMINEMLENSKKHVKVPRRTFRRTSRSRKRLIPGGLLQHEGKSNQHFDARLGPDSIASEPTTPPSHPRTHSHKLPNIASALRRRMHLGETSRLSEQPEDHEPGSLDYFTIEGHKSVHLAKIAPNDEQAVDRNHPNFYTRTSAEDLGSAHMPTLDWEDAEDVDAQSDSMVSVHGDDAKSKLGPIGPAHFETSTRKLKSKNTASQIKSSGRVPSRSLQLNDIAEFNRHAAANLLGNVKQRISQLQVVWTDFHISEFAYALDDVVADLQQIWLVWVGLLGSPIDASTFKSKMILYGLVRSWDVYRAVLDCSRYTPDNDDVLLNTSLWVAEMAAKFGIDDHRGRVAQTAIFRMGCRCSDHVNSRVLFLRSRFIQSALITLSPLSKGQPVNTDQVHMFLVECQLFLSLGISGSRMLLLSLERGLQRLFVDCNSFFGGYQEPAVKGAALLLVSMTTMLANSRVLATHKTTKFIRELTDSSLIDLKEDSKLTSLVSTLVCSKYPVIYNPQGIRQLTVEWEEGGLIFGRACDTLWRILLHSDGIHNYKSSGFVEQAALSGLSVVCLTELSIPDKSLQNRRLIKNCLACLASRLFSSRTDIDLMDFIGETETRRLAMDVMKAIIEHFDRASGEILTDNALVLRELLNLLLIILLKTPELIVRDSHMVDAGALAIRDFLIDQVIYRCVHPEIQVGSRAHKYNQELCSTNSEHGLVLFLNTANYSQRQSMSLGDFVLSTEDEQHFIGNPAESVKQMGEVLYITFMMQFDENNRLESLGEISK